MKSRKKIVYIAIAIALCGLSLLTSCKEVAETPIVITSYSIHYTKLYDLRLRLKAIRAKMPGLLLQISIYVRQRYICTMVLSIQMNLSIL